MATRLVEYNVVCYGRCQLYDPLALAVLLDMSLFKLVSAAVKIVTGVDELDLGRTRTLPQEAAREAS